MFYQVSDHRCQSVLRIPCPGWEHSSLRIPYIAGKRVTTGMWVYQLLCDFSTISSPICNQNGLKLWGCIVDVDYFVEKSAEGPRCITARLIQGEMQLVTEEAGPKKGEYIEDMQTLTGRNYCPHLELTV